MTEPRTNNKCPCGREIPVADCPDVWETECPECGRFAVAGNLKTGEVTRWSEAPEITQPPPTKIMKEDENLYKIEMNAGTPYYVVAKDYTGAVERITSHFGGMDEVKITSVSDVASYVVGLTESSTEIEIATAKTQYGSVAYRCDDSAKGAVYAAALAFFREHECFSGESYNQCDAPQLDVCNLIDELIEAFNFNQKWDEVTVSKVIE